MLTRQHAPVAQMSSSQPLADNMRDLDSKMEESSSPWERARLNPETSAISSKSNSVLNSMQPPGSHFSNSQESSSTDTSSSNNSFTRLPPYSRATQPMTESTPPTSSDGPSDQSQDSQSNRFTYPSTAQQRSPNPRRPRTPPSYADTSHRPSRLELHSTPISPASTNVRSGGLFYGQKRTANGELKPGSASLPGSPISATASGHSRNMSIDSTGSNISEVRSLGLCENSRDSRCIGHELTIVYTAVVTTPCSPLVRHGQGPKRLAGTIVGRGRKSNLTDFINIQAARSPSVCSTLSSHSIGTPQTRRK